MSLAMVRFHARSVVLEHPAGAGHLLGFADHPEEARRYLLLQREFEPAEAMEEAPSYYLEWCDPEHAGRGGIASLTLEQDRLTLTFDPDVGALLELGQLVITFDPTGLDRDALIRRLRALFAGCGTLLSLS